MNDFEYFKYSRKTNQSKALEYKKVSSDTTGKKVGFWIYLAILVWSFYAMLTISGGYSFLFLALLTFGLVLSREGYKEVVEDEKEGFKIKLNQLEFNPDKFNLNPDHTIAIGVNEEKEELLIIRRPQHTKAYTYEIIPFNKIIESRVVKDKQIITTTSKGAMIGGAILAGGIGAAIAGIASNKTTNENINELTLEIVLDDIQKPRVTIPFLSNRGYPYKTTSAIGREGIELTETWYRTMTVIINRNQNESKMQ